MCIETEAPIKCVMQCRECASILSFIMKTKLLSNVFCDVENVPLFREIFTVFLKTMKTPLIIKSGLRHEPLCCYGISSETFYRLYGFK